jgi:hypothetical protein
MLDPRYSSSVKVIARPRKRKKKRIKSYVAQSKPKELTSIQRSNEAPVSGMHYVARVAALPALSPLDAKTVVGAIAVGPETEVERRDEENPIQCRACAGMGRIVGFWRAEMEGVGMPCAWGIAIFDQTISYLQFE